MALTPRERWLIYNFKKVLGQSCYVCHCEVTSCLTYEAIYFLLESRGNLMSVAQTISPPSLEGVGGGWLCVLFRSGVSLPPSLRVSLFLSVLSLLCVLSTVHCQLTGF
jgi:hypothetical protein